MTPHPTPSRPGQGGALRNFGNPPPLSFPFSQTAPLPPCSAQNRGPPPHVSSPERCASCGVSGETGGGDYPSGHGQGGWGIRAMGWGYPPRQKFIDAPQPGIFLPDPTPRVMHKWGGVGGLAIFEVHADPGTAEVLRSMVSARCSSKNESGIICQGFLCHDIPFQKRCSQSVYRSFPESASLSEMQCTGFSPG